MGAVTTLAATVVAAAGAIALYRFVDRRAREFRDILTEVKNHGEKNRGGKVIDYERDPDSGVFKPKP